MGLAPGTQFANWAILGLDILIFLLLIGYLIGYANDNPRDDYSIYTAQRVSDFRYAVEPIATLTRRGLLFILLLVFAEAITTDLWRATNAFGTGVYSTLIESSTNAFKWITFSFEAVLILFINCIITGNQLQNDILFVITNILCITILSTALDIYQPQAYWYILIAIVQNVLSLVTYFIVYTNFRTVTFNNARNQVKTAEPTILSLAVPTLLISMIGLLQYISAYFKLDPWTYEFIFNIYTFTIRLTMFLILILLFRP